MTTSIFDNAKDLFAPMTDAFKTFQTAEVPEAAREYVKRAAETTKERVAELQAGAEKVTAAVETAVSGSISETAKISRSLQQAAYEDALAFVAGIEKLAGAKSISEAFQIQGELARAQGEVVMSRAKATTEYLGKLVADGAKNAQDNLSKVTQFNRKVA